MHQDLWFKYMYLNSTARMNIKLWSSKQSLHEIDKRHSHFERSFCINHRGSQELNEWNSETQLDSAHGAVDCFPKELSSSELQNLFRIEQNNQTLKEEMNEGKWEVGQFFS